MVKKRPIPRLEDCIDTKGMLDSEESDSYLQELRDTIKLTETVYVFHIDRLNDLQGGPSLDGYVISGLIGFVSNISIWKFHFCDK